MTVATDRLEGLSRLSDFFGFVPDFHDWKIRSFAWQLGSLRMAFDGFRMTSKMDDAGSFILDRHAIVSVICHEVSSWEVRCGEGGIVDSVRWLDVDMIPEEVRTRLVHQAAGPRPDDVALAIEPAYGIEGWISCTRISFDVEPISGGA